MEYNDAQNEGINTINNRKLRYIFDAEALQYGVNCYDFFNDSSSFFNSLSSAEHS